MISIEQKIPNKNILTVLTEVSNDNQKIKSYKQIFEDFYDVLQDTKRRQNKKNIINDVITEETSERFEIFNSNNLTEDYELGLRLYRKGLKTLFVNQRQNPNDPNSVISVGEFFPNTFWGTVKQRSRWMAGIVFQGWKEYGWKGPFKTKYFLFRDRKVLVSAFGSFLSNLLFIYFIFTFIVNNFTNGIGYTIVAQHSILWNIMHLLMVFMIWRLVHRFYFTFKWYGFWYAIQSPFRLLMDNFINFVALCRSVMVFWRNRKTFSWDSTTHY